MKEEERKESMDLKMSHTVEQKIHFFAEHMIAKINKFNEMSNDPFIDSEQVRKSQMQKEVYKNLLEKFEDLFNDVLLSE